MDGALGDVDHFVDFPRSLFFWKHEKHVDMLQISTQIFFQKTCELTKIVLFARAAFHFLQYLPSY